MKPGLDLLIHHRRENNILELKSFIKTLQVLPDEVAILQKEKIEIAKMNLLIEEGREFSLRGSISKIENIMIRYALNKHSENQAKAAQSVGLSDRAIRFITK